MQSNAVKNNLKATGNKYLSRYVVWHFVPKSVGNFKVALSCIIASTHNYTNREDCANTLQAVPAQPVNLTTDQLSSYYKLCYSNEPMCCGHIGFQVIKKLPVEFIEPWLYL